MISYELSETAFHEDYQRISDWLYKRSGLVYPEKKKSLLMHRMHKVCATHKISNVRLLVENLENGIDNTTELAVIHAASTNHTYFFREHQVLDFFKDTILPELPNDARVWSAAASTGDEAFTIAMLAAEARGLVWAKNNLAILGTDISNVVIEHAEKAVYGGSHLDKVSSELLRRYFTPAGAEQFTVKDDLREFCTFRRMNLTINPYPFQRAFHVVFCRNVLYYFDRDVQREVVEAIYDVTEPGGWLLTSVTVSLRGLGSRWVPVDTGIYRKPF